MINHFGSYKEPSLTNGFTLMERAVKAMEKASVPKSESSTPKLTVESFDNHIYFYADVDTDRCLAMIKSIRDMDSKLRIERETRWVSDDKSPHPIWLHIQSGGGDLYAGLAVADQLVGIQTPVYSIVEGLCASAATLISLSCQKRFIMPMGFMLIHQFKAGVWGTHEQFKDEMILQEMIMKVMIDFYMDHSRLNRDTVTEMLTHDTWFNAAKAIDAGLIDEIWKR
jgi:ATP-dependent protease ClpP protease subunit